MKRHDFWQLVVATNSQLRLLVLQFHPANAPGPSLPITARAAEAACEEVRQEIIQEWSDERPELLFDRFCSERNAEDLLTLLDQVWFGIPESRAATQLPGFDVLCDLLSDPPDEEDLAQEGEV